MKHLLEVDDLTVEEVAFLLDRADGPDGEPVLAGRGVALLFEKPSARTRQSMEMAVVRLGGHPLTIRGEEVGFDTRESVEDLTRTLACYHAAVGARVFSHRTVERMAAVDSLPVLNLLSDEAHPMQALADLLTIRQELGGTSGRVVAYVGDGNNVCRSLAVGAALTGMQVRVAAPPGYELTATDVERVTKLGGSLVQTTDPQEAVSGADVVYTDVWASMGQEDEAQARRQAFAGYTVTSTLMDHAAAHAIFLHCLPAHRGEEVEAAVLEGARSRVWQQAENRMHAARAALELVVGEART